MNATPSNPGPTSAARTPAPSGTLAPMTLADFWEQLTWPRLLEAPRLALRPARIGLAFIFLIGVAVIVGGADLIDSRPNQNALGDYLSRDVSRQTSALRKGVTQMDVGLVCTASYRMFVSGPGGLISQSPWMMVVAVPILLAWTALMGGAISRMAACDFAQGLRITWPQGLGFAAGKWLSLFGALAIPLVVIWSLCLVIAAGAWALMGVPVLNLVGALGWGLFLATGLVVAVVSIAYVLGHGMLVPAVACDGVDAVDAIQHGYAYVLAKPLRLVIYLFILLVQAAIVVLVAGIVVKLMQDVTAGAAMEWAGPRGRKSILGEKGLDGTAGAASWLIRLWSAMPGLVLSAYLVSLYWCSATMLYLAMRRVCDGQDPSEIWMPGTVEGTATAQS
ncbi:MAG: hypothetical protein KF768_01220 [Phycisphaeraceae bacterium]|nr:hypothetical protein [Phycisphaeraceae bacterium]